MLTLSKNYKKN